MELWDPLSTDPIRKWMSWFCGGNHLPSKSTRFFKSCTDICIPTTANKPSLLLPLQHMVTIFTGVVVVLQIVLRADTEDKERKRTWKQSADSEGTRFNSSPILMPPGPISWLPYLKKLPKNPHDLFHPISPYSLYTTEESIISEPILFLSSSLCSNF